MDHAVVVDEQHPFAGADLNRLWARSGRVIVTTLVELPVESPVCAVGTVGLSPAHATTLRATSKTGVHRHRIALPRRSST